MLRLIPLLIIPIVDLQFVALGGNVAGHHDIQDR